jgi:predicted protein tyrosine phosphatase
MERKTSICEEAKREGKGENAVNIEIFSAENAVKEIKQHSKKWHVVSLRDCKYGGDTHNLDGLDEDTKGIFIKKFDDVSHMKYKMMGYTPPEQSDIEDILNWVKVVQPKNLMVHCWAGVSRSSATAYVIACTIMEPEEAIKLLIPGKHIPNEMIIEYGASILNNRNIWLTYARKFVV